MAGFTTESPSKKFVLLADSGKCENLLKALESWTAIGYRIVQCWGLGGGQGSMGAAGQIPLTHVLLEKS